MRLGSVILKVATRTVAGTMWYFPLLKPYVDHVPVKEDLSDLAEQIKWCREHDEECKGIAKKAGELYAKYVAKEGLLDYLEVVLQGVSRRFVNAPDWWSPETTSVPPPSLKRPSCKCFKGEDDDVYCARCQAIHEGEEREKDEARRAKDEKMRSSQGNKDRIRERMREKAAKRAKT